MKERNKKVHIIGICGKGMSALAIILRQKGWRVSGSDQGFYDPVYGLLKRNKIKFSPKYSPKNIPRDADLIIIGKHAGLTREENKEVAAASRSGIKIQSLPEALGELAKKTENTVVAGSFGKSTVTALLAWCLKSSGKDPSYFIGASTLNLGNNAHLGKSKNFILEGDEYPASNWDDTPKFLYLRPKNLILISALHDHINVFPTEREYLQPYQKLISLVPKNGLIVYADEGKNLNRLVRRAKCRTIAYGFSHKSLWHPENIRYGKTSTFFLYRGKEKMALLKTSLLGNHNIENIVGACALLLEKKLMKPTELFKAVKTFKGLSGRLDLKTKNGAVPVYEGFGSSYAKAKSIFDALELHFPTKRIVTIFEPHTFSWRNQEAKKWYKDIFKTSDEVIILPPPKHGKSTHQQMSFKEILNEVKKNKKNAYGAKSEREVLKILKKIITKDSLIVLVSSGSLLGLSKSVPRLVKRLF